MQLYFEIETDTAGTWRDFTKRVSFEEFGDITYAVGHDGVPALDPPGQLLLDNTDGYFWLAPDAINSEFATGWEGRRARVRAELPGEALFTLGTFRIKQDMGFVCGQDGWATLHLEGLLEEIKRGDASEVSHGRGWYADLPWTLAIDKLSQPEGGDPITLPGASIPYEELRRSISSAGRPGDTQADGWHEITERAVDVCYNQASNVYAYLTAEGSIYELDATTGVYTAVTVTAGISSTYHALRIWWKPESAGTGKYLILTAAADASYGWGGWRAKERKKVSCVFFWHDEISYLATGTWCVTPAIIRDNIRTRPTGWVDGTDRYANTMRVYGTDYYAYDDNDGISNDNLEKREPLIIPFDQYAYALEHRSGDSGQFHHTEIFRIKRGNGWQGSTVSSYTPDGANRWTVDAITPGDDATRWSNLDLRAGSGYYQYVLIHDDGIWEQINPADYRSDTTGLIHYIGQGPMLDVSFEHSGLAAYDGKFWFSYITWTSAAGYTINCALWDGSTKQEMGIYPLGFHALPTFLVCDITRPYEDLGFRGALLAGYLDYDPQPRADHISGPDDITHGSFWAPESGILSFPVQSADSSSAPVFSANGGPVVRFRSYEGNSAIDRHYRPRISDIKDAHLSGRWTPLAIGFKRYLQSSSPYKRTHYNCIISCIDRAELEPYAGVPAADASWGWDDFEVSRAGTATYRLLYLHVTIESNGGAPYTWAHTITDTRGPGIDIQHHSKMPWMGFSRLLRGLDGDEQNLNNAEHVYGYNPSDRGLYRFQCDDNGLGRPLLLGTVPHSDLWTGLGTLAVGNDDGDATLPVVAGVSWPVFPGSGFDPLPNGNYQGWVYGSKHMGRVGLLDNRDTNKLTAIMALADLADYVPLFDRDGQLTLKPYPTTDTAITLEIEAPSEVAGARRSRSEIVNTSQRSTYDVLPGEISITRYVTAGSRFAAEPVVTGLGTYAVDLELRCILAGRPSDGLRESQDDWRSHALFGWRMNTARVKTTLREQVLAGAYYLPLDGIQDIGIGDTLTLSLEDQDIEITSMSPATNTVYLSRAVINGYGAGEQVIIDPAMSGRWSHQLAYDQDLDQYVGVAELVYGAGAGSRTLRVNSADAFAPGTLLRVHPKGTTFGPGQPTPNYLDAYRVIRVRSREETGGNTSEIDISSIETGSGLVEAAYAGDPITCYVNIAPVSRSQRIGQSGIMVGLIGEGSTAEDDGGEQPLAEGDLIRVNYPGLELKRNQHSRITVTDSDSQQTHGTRKAKSRQPNKYGDRELQLIIATRQVRRGADPRIVLNLDAVTMRMLANRKTLLEAMPLDVITYTDYDLLPDVSGSSINAVILSHTIKKDGSVYIVCEQLDGSAPGGRLASNASDPTQLDFTSYGDDGENVLNWDPPAVGDFDEVEIRWSTDHQPKHLADGTQLGTYSAGTYTTKHTGLSNGTLYYYTAWAKSTSGGLSDPAYAQATPAADIAAVTGVTATNGDKQVTLDWTDPADDDLVGVQVRYNTDGTYPADLTEGTSAGFAQRGAEQLVVSGLDNGRRYSFALFGLDNGGSVAASVEIDGDPDFDPADYASVTANYTAHSLRDSYADAAVIDALADSSSAGNDLVKWSDATRPTFRESDSGYNDLPIVEHDNALGAKVLLKSGFDFQGADNTTGMMIIFVGQAGSTGSSQTLLSRYGGGTNSFYWRGQIFVIYEKTTGDFALCSSSFAVDTPYIFCAVWYPQTIAANQDGIARTFRNDGNEVTDDGDAPNAMVEDAGGAFCIGSTYATGNGLDGKWSQIILCDEYDEGARKLIIERLREKYGTFESITYPCDYSQDYAPDYDAIYGDFSDDFSDDYQV